MVKIIFILISGLIHRFKFFLMVSLSFFQSLIFTFKLFIHTQLISF